MRLGTETGSLTNYLLSGTKGAPAPKVGDGATILMWTDRRACTIVGLDTFKTGPNAGKVKAVRVQEDKATRTDANGMSEAQTYSYEPNPDAGVRVFTLRKTGAFKDGGNSLRIGERDTYYDFSF